ncbi:MAG: methyltransferase domain-containing protein [Candidatus Omnitrophica bacterium]|nr:methyltransferase domain-containing protein [Candidatus Omnitrophota bacterium]
MGNNTARKKVLTYQMKKWGQDFGRNYTDRNNYTVDMMDRLYKKNYGITRTRLNELFVGGLKKSIKILEVGSNIGTQLASLQKMGFKNLYGIEINKYAIDRAKSKTKDINIIEGSIFDIPFKDRYFDLVFTSGVLIHINPKDIEKGLREIYRCASSYIWVYEFYSDRYENILYRGEKNLLWKANYPNVYTRIFPDLKIIKHKFLKYLENDNKDVMALLKKNRK